MVLKGIKTLYQQTVKALATLVIGVGVGYTLLRRLESILRGMFDPSDQFYDLFDMTKSVEVALWAIIGVVILGTIAVAAIYLFMRAGRYVNNDSYDDDQFGKWN